VYDFLNNNQKIYKPSQSFIEPIPIALALKSNTTLKKQHYNTVKLLYNTQTISKVKYVK